ncbi:MAG TPA: PA14 domain-containing protein [Sedimentisphaerales bacterium]|nr:PA14 domain-containing protein [Sedimentisphaerales bacterium]
MYRRTMSVPLILGVLVIFFPGRVQANQDLRPGLAGTYFNSRDFSDADKRVDILPSLDQDWAKSRGSDWAAKWRGFIEGPTTGKVNFFVDVRDSFQLNIDGQVAIDGLDESGAREGEFIMEKGRKYPVEILYISLHGQARMRLYWQWAGQPKVVVPLTAISYDASKLPKDAKLFNYDTRPSEDGDSGPTGFAAELPAFTGGDPPYANTDYLDGQFRPAVGAHNFEVIRCNRTHPDLVTEKVPYYPDAGFENIGFTYNHQPMICYWHNKFWVIYESGPVHEHQPPCYALITWSEDGRNWHKPQTIFPAEKFRNRKMDNKLQYSLSHQRMNWYVAPDGRLIASGFHGLPNAPNDGKGVGRVVREIKGPGNYGPIYWVRYNKYQGYGPENSPYYPYYKEAPDKEFVKAIDGLLANKLMVQQWYEEDRDNEGGFFAFAGGNVRYAKAFDWYYLPDKRIVGMWKWKKMVVANRWKPGQISEQGQGKDIYYGGAKIWGQRTSDGKYALVYNPVENTTWRHPLSVTTGDDGMNFNTYFLNVHGETPLMRFGGGNKDGGGAQYVRGIIPGNGTPPDGAMWLTYSSNKEDIFVTRVPVPIKGTVDKDVSDNFEDMRPGGIVTNWNIYSGIWNPVRVVKDKRNNVLRLQDKDPYDYANAVRVFPETTKVQVSFDLRPQQVGRDNLEIEIQNYKGQRPVRIIIDGKNGKVKANKGDSMNEVASFTAGKWLKLDIDVDTTAGKYDLKLDGKNLVSGATFAETLDNSNNPYKSRFATPTVERIVFRTGTWRMKDFSRYGFGANDFRKNEPDLTGPDEAVAQAVYDIDNFRTITVKAGSCS